MATVERPMSAGDAPEEAPQKKTGWLIAAVVIVAAALVGLGSWYVSRNDEATTDQPADEAAVTEVSDVIEVMFDGNDCTAAGPSSLVPGNHSFVLNDTTNANDFPFGGALKLRFVADGHTYQDVVDYFDETGGQGASHLRPEWLDSVAVNFDAPELSLADNQRQYHHRLELGTYALVAVSENGEWLCGFVDVVEG